ncbi:MAG: hypothetical protein QOH21_152 [Acidobacteriota bacterium]|nr:hypothetical protein [Acidobacteriota bacterium]
MVAALALVTAAASAQPAPPAPPPPPELSTIVIPIRASLAALQPELEARVPVTFADTETQSGFDIRYEVKRDPLRLAMTGPGLRTTTIVHYGLEACRGRFPCISCGFGEERRQAQITLHSKLEWDPSWRIRSITKPLPTDYPRRCQVTWFDFDITDRFIAPVVNNQLAIAARTIDRNTPAAANLKPQAQQIWTALQTPVELAPRTWLVLEPAAVALTPISGSGLDVTSTLSLTAQTRVVVGNKPVVAPKPLPPLRVAAAVANGVRVPFDLEVPYEDVSAVASRELAGRKYKVNGRDLAIESLTVGFGTGGKLRVDAMVDYRGGVLRNYHGVIHLEGTPRFDPPTASIVFPDLDYTLAERGGLVRRIAERAAHDTLRARLRENMRVSLGTQLATLRTEITRALTRPLAAGVMLRGRADAIQPVSVTPRETLLTVRVVAVGSAEVTIANR